jgi:hypothetical protein
MSDISLEELTQRYLDAVVAEEQARFSQSAIAWTLRDEGQKAALQHVANMAQRKLYKLQHQAEVYEFDELKNDRPTLTWLHLSILVIAKAALVSRALAEDPSLRDLSTSNCEWQVLKGWANRMVDEQWTPAELRRQIRAFIQGPKDDPSTIISKAESSATKMKKIADEAVEAKVLPAVLTRIESAFNYAEHRLEEAVEAE